VNSLGVVGSGSEAMNEAGFSPMTDIDEIKQERIWSALYEKILGVLRRFGAEDHFGEADYLLVDDNYGHRRHTIEIHKLRILDPGLIKMPRALLHDFGDWEVVIAVDVPGTEKSWPRMGLIVRKHEVVDGLQRNYLPAEFQNVTFEGSRPGTGFD
jgi:hypothetical protein